MSGKGILLTNPSGPLDTSLTYRTVLGYCDHRSHFLRGKCGTCSRTEIWKGAGSHLPSQVGAWVPGTLNLLSLTKFPGKVHGPTKIHQTEVSNVAGQSKPAVDPRLCQACSERTKT